MFNTNTRQVEGILASGPDDYVTMPQGCLGLNTCASIGCNVSGPRIDTMASYLGAAGTPIDPDWNDAEETSVSPAAAAYHSDEHVFLTAADGTLWWRTWVSSNSVSSFWTAWQAIGGIHTNSSAAATAFNNLLYLFALDTGTNKLSYATYDGTNWSTWTSTGQIYADVGLLSTDKLIVLARDGNGAVREGIMNSSGGFPATWPTVAGKTTLSAPRGVGAINGGYAVIRGSDNRVYLNSLNDNGTVHQWAGWNELPGGGLTISTPGAEYYYGNMWVWIRTPDNSLYVNTFGTRGWSVLYTQGNDRRVYEL